MSRPPDGPIVSYSAEADPSTRGWGDLSDAGMYGESAGPRGRAPASGGSRLYPTAMIVFFVVFTSYLVYLLTRADIGDNGLLRAISDSFVLLGAVACVGACWYAVRMLRGTRISLMAGRAWYGWICLGGAALTYAIGQGIWTWYDANYTSAALPFPALYDPFYLLVYPLSWLGIALLIPRGGTVAGRTRLLLDAGIAVASALAILWFYILGPTISTLSGTPLAKVVALAYPLGDLSLCVAAALLLFGSSATSGLNASLGRLAIGVTWLAVTDSLYAYALLQGTYHTGLIQDVGWPMSWLFIGWAALVYPADLARRAGQQLADDPGSRITRLSTTGAALRAIAPILLALLTCAVLLLEAVVRNTAPVLQIILVCAGLILLPVVRQMLTLVDNLILNQRLRMALGQTQEAFQQSQRELVGASSRAERYDELRAGIQELQNVHAQLARGNFGVRARVQGPLTPVAQSLNLLIDRLNRWLQLASVNQALENEAHQLRQALDSMSEGRGVPVPTSQSHLPTGSALIAAARLRSQLNLRFARLRNAIGALGRSQNTMSQMIQQAARASYETENQSGQRQLQLAQEVLSRVEKELRSDQSLLQELWGEANVYTENVESAMSAPPLNETPRAFGW